MSTRLELFLLLLVVMCDLEMLISILGIHELGIDVHVVMRPSKLERFRVLAR